MDRNALITAVAMKIGDTDPKIWRIGIANEPKETRRYWAEVERKATFFWAQWEADSLVEAKDVVSYFVNEKGVRIGEPGVTQDVGHVYVYLF